MRSPFRLWSIFFDCGVGTCVERISAGCRFEAFQQTLWCDALAFVAGDVMEHAAFVHHYDPLAEMDGLGHGVGDHERGEFIASYNFTGQCDDLVRAFRVEGGGVFVEQKEVWLEPGCHEKSERLALPAGE